MSFRRHALIFDVDRILLEFNHSGTLLSKRMVRTYFPIIISYLPSPMLAIIAFRSCRTNDFFPSGRMHGDREDDVSLQTDTRIPLSRSYSRVPKTALDISNVSRMWARNESPQSSLKIFLQRTSRVQLGPNIHIIVAMFVISNGALEWCPSSNNCVRVRACDVCNRYVYTLMERNCASSRYDDITRSSKNERSRDSRPRKKTWAFQDFKVSGIFKGFCDKMHDRIFAFFFLLSNC